MFGAEEAEEIPDLPRYRLPMLYKVGMVCCLYLCFITVCLVVSGPAALQVLSVVLGGTGNQTVDFTNDSERYTELRLLGFSEMVEKDQPLDLRFEIVNHLGSGHNYTYTVTGLAGGSQDILEVGWRHVRDGESLQVTQSVLDFPPPGILGKIVIGLDTGEKADFLVTRYEASYVIIDPRPGILRKLWEVSFGTERDDRLEHICTGQDGTYVLAGTTSEYDSSLTLVSLDVFLAEVDGEGNKGWQRLHNRSDLEAARDMVAAGDRGYAIAGRTFRWDDRQRIYVLRVDEKGDTVWEREWGENASNMARCIAPAEDGFVVAGYTGRMTSAMQDLYVAKLDTDGDLVWEATYGGNLHDSAHCITPCVEGGYLIAGYSDCYGVSATGQLRLIYLVRIDEEGDLIWEMTHGRGSWNEPHEIIQTRDGGFLIIGKSSSGGATSDAYVLRVDKMGQKIWERFCTGRDNSCLGDGFTTSRGSYILGGYSYITRNGTSDAFFVEIDDSGQTIWQTIIEGVGFAAMGGMPDGDILFCRSVEIVGSGEDAAISRYEVCTEAGRE